MNTGNKNFKAMLLLIALLVAGLIMVNGCKKSEPAAPPEPSPPAAEPEETAAVTIEQTICPVMAGNKIDKNVFVEYKGKKVYFCCADCEAKFEADPEKYIAKLPQFKQ